MMDEYTVASEQDCYSVGNEAVRFSRPNFIIRKNGVKVGKINDSEPELARKLAEALGTTVR